MPSYCCPSRFAKLVCLEMRLINWLPRAMHVLRDELKNIQVTNRPLRRDDGSADRGSEACSPNARIVSGQTGH